MSEDLLPLSYFPASGDILLPIMKVTQHDDYETQIFKLLIQVTTVPALQNTVLSQIARVSSHIEEEFVDSPTFQMIIDMVQRQNISKINEIIDSFANEFTVVNHRSGSYFTLDVNFGGQSVNVIPTFNLLFLYQANSFKRNKSDKDLQQLLLSEIETSIIISAYLQTQIQQSKYVKVNNDDSALLQVSKLLLNNELLEEEVDLIDKQAEHIDDQQIVNYIDEFLNQYDENKKVRAENTQLNLVIFLLSNEIVFEDQSVLFHLEDTVQNTFQNEDQTDIFIANVLNNKKLGGYVIEPTYRAVMLIALSAEESNYTSELSAILEQELNSCRMVRQPQKQPTASTTAKITDEQMQNKTTNMTSTPATVQKLPEVAAHQTPTLLNAASPSSFRERLQRTIKYSDDIVDQKFSIPFCPDQFEIEVRVRDQQIQTEQITIKNDKRVLDNGEGEYFNTIKRHILCLEQIGLNEAQAYLSSVLTQRKYSEIFALLDVCGEYINVFSRQPLEKLIVDQELVKEFASQNMQLIFNPAVQYYQYQAPVSALIILNDIFDGKLQAIEYLDKLKSKFQKKQTFWEEQILHERTQLQKQNAMQKEQLTNIVNIVKQSSQDTFSYVSEQMNQQITRLQNTGVTIQSINQKVYDYLTNTKIDKLEQHKTILVLNTELKQLKEENQKFFIDQKDKEKIKHYKLLAFQNAALKIKLQEKK
ncbi:Hypothetical_protein [Hexamita inflata]|uniref:Hypothetical_protein n=1 Tax=Hexamita inflata TaxID=28002 RepID=A0AA86TP39_9EUKA|nr:Hypothetical protein HINF_LOCUS11999 [Hexamita inflata]